MTTNKGLKVLIQVDFEGMSSVVTFDETYPGHVHFERNCKLLTNEVNAAVEGALEAGATEIIVRDGHSANISVNHEELNKAAKLVRGRRPGTPETMVICVDESYDALLFIGAHARAGKENGVLSHTMSLKVVELLFNEMPISECAFNGLYAGMFGVPVVFIAGDSETQKESIETFGKDIYTTVTKEPYGRTCAICYHPEVVCSDIKSKVKEAIKNREKFSPLKLNAPYTLKLKVRENPDSDEISYIEYTSNDLYEVMKKFWSYL